MADTDNPYATNNLLKEKGRSVSLRDFEMLAARKEIKNDRSFRSVSYYFLSTQQIFKSSYSILTNNVFLISQMVAYPKEERLLTFREGILYVLKRVDVAKRSIRSFLFKKESSNQ